MQASPGVRVRIMKIESYQRLGAILIQLSKDDSKQCEGVAEFEMLKSENEALIIEALELIDGVLAEHPSLCREVIDAMHSRDKENRRLLLLSVGKLLKNNIDPASQFVHPEYRTELMKMFKSQVRQWIKEFPNERESIRQRVSEDLGLTHEQYTALIIETPQVDLKTLAGYFRIDASIRKLLSALANGDRVTARGCKKQFGRTLAQMKSDVKMEKKREFPKQLVLEVLNNIPTQ
jgi:hypothetical protein